jgi:hypothetical protein
MPKLPACSPQKAAAGRIVVIKIDLTTLLGERPDLQFTGAIEIDHQFCKFTQADRFGRVKIVGIGRQRCLGTRQQERVNDIFDIIEIAQLIATPDLDRLPIETSSNPDP